MRPDGRRVKPVKPFVTTTESVGHLFFTGFTGFTRLPCGFIAASHRFHRFHTPGCEMLHDMTSSCLAALNNLPTAMVHRGRALCSARCALLRGLGLGAASLLTPPHHIGASRHGAPYARLSWTGASCGGARPDCQSLAVVLARMPLRR